MAADPPIPAWLTSLPLAPEYHPSETDFADPIAFISRIEHHAATFGICKIIPPLPKPSKRFVLSNLNRSLSTSTSPASFTTRHQELGSRRRKPPSFSKMWDSGHLYTVDQFEAKSKAFARSHLAGIKEVTPLLIESLFWKAAAAAEKPIYIEYAINVPGSGFSAPDRRKRTRGVDRSEGRTAGSRLSNSPWNLQVIARSPGSLTRFMPDDVPGVTSPMVYIGMMFSWFAWHIEDHELHSLNFLHTGAPKTWYAVPGEHAATLEDIVRVESYGGSLDRLGALSLLGEKTTVLSPEVLVASGVPCCRLVQHPGEYVVTFPRAYHVGFSHGFNCGEAANFATPQWLKVAKEAALRRAAMNLLPMLSHQQLLYLLTMSFISRIPRELLSGVRSSRLRDRQKEEREILVKREFLKDMRNENRLLCALLAKEPASYAVLWEPELLPSLFNGSVPFPTSHSLEAKSMSFNVETVEDIDDGEDDLPCGLNVNSGSLACHACGILGYPFMAIVQPSERALKEFLPLNSEDFHQKLQESGSLNLPSSLQSITDKLISSMSETPHARSGFSLFNGNSKEFSSDIATVLDMIGEKVSRIVSSEPVESVSGRMIHSSIVSLPLDSVNVDGLGNILSPMEHQSDTFSSLDEDAESAPNKDTKIKWNTSNRFMRPRIFCLQHALEIEELLQSRGGRNLLIICHSDYIKIKAHAISVAEEIGTEFNIKDSPLESASPKDLDLINISIDAEHEELGEDWTSKLGLNLRPSQIKPRKRLPSNQEQLPLALRQIFSVPSPTLISNLKWASRKSRTPYKVIGTILPKPACDAEIEKAEPVTMKSNADPVKEIIVYKSRKRGLSTMTKNHNDRDAHLNEEVKRGNTEISELLHNLCTSEVPNSDNSCDLEKLELQEDTIAEDHEIRDAAEKSTAHGVERTLDLADSSSATVHTDHSEVLHVVPVSWELNFDSSQSSSAYGSNGAVHSAGNSSAPDCSEVLLEIPVSWEPNCDGYFCNFERSDDQSVTPLSSPNYFEQQLRVAVPEEPKMDINATGANDHSVQNSTEKDYRSMVVYKYVRRNKRKREIENTTSVAHSSHAFVRGPCEGLRPRGARAEYEREEAKTVKNKIPVKKMKSKKNKGFSECDLEGCRMSFRTKEELLLHKRNRCTFKGCGKQFRSHHYTVRHQRVHDEERPLGCPWKGCRKSFKWGWARTEHVRLHTGERPYKCQVTGCGMAFRFMSEFSLHRRKSGHSVDSSAR